MLLIMKLLISFMRTLMYVNLNESKVNEHREGKQEMIQECLENVLNLQYLESKLDFSIRFGTRYCIIWYFLKKTLPVNISVPYCKKKGLELRTFVRFMKIYMATQFTLNGSG